MLRAMRFRWVTIFLDIPNNAFERGVTFWREVTGSGLSPLRGAAGEFATLLPARGDAYLRVQRVGAGPGGCHLDLHVDVSSESLSAAASRATAALPRPEGIPVRLLLQGRSDAAPGDRVTGHVDFACDSRRLLADVHAGVGARVLSTFPHWIVLADPVGRQYCLTGRDPRTGTRPARDETAATRTS
jgi:Glyoxalase-like domain